MEDGNGNSVRVTNQMIYDELRQVERQVADIKEGIAVHLSLGAHPQAKEKLDDHEKRVRSLEAWKNAIPVATVLAIASIIVAILRAA